MPRQRTAGWWASAGSPEPPATCPPTTWREPPRPTPGPFTPSSPSPRRRLRRTRESSQAPLRGWSTVRGSDLSRTSGRATTLAVSLCLILRWSPCTREWCGIVGRGWARTRGSKKRTLLLRKLDLKALVRCSLQGTGNGLISLLASGSLTALTRTGSTSART